MNKINPYLILLALAGLLVSGIGCHWIAAYDTAEAPVAPDTYLCSAEIFRQLDNTHRFTEQWRAYVYPKIIELESGDVIQDAGALCDIKRAEYIAKSMSPHFNWQSPLNLLFRDDSRLAAGDCTFEEGTVNPGPEEKQPAIYGAPAGAVLSWEGDGEQPVPAAQAFVKIELRDADGNLHVATPGVKAARLRLAERHGALDEPFDFGATVYDPAKRHVRVSDFSIELVTPFDIADISVTDLYIQSIGTIISQSISGNQTYFVSNDVGKSKFYFRAVGESDGQSATDSRCFVNEQTGTSFRLYQGEGSGPLFQFILPVPMVGGQSLDLEIRLISPAGALFQQHQPFVQLRNRETSATEVDLALGIQERESGEDGVVFDHDGPADLTDKVLWFEDFEQPGERFLGGGLTLSDVPFPPGSHEITVVAYDASGAYNYDTATLNVIAVPEANDDLYETDEDITLNVSDPGVLSNDTDSDGLPLHTVLATGPSNGSLILNVDGSFAYTPNPDFNGEDSFSYQASNGTQDSGYATVTITVNPVNDDPVAKDDAYSTDEDTALTVPAPGVLGNDEDVDGDSLKAVPGSGPSNGTLTLNADGSFTYTPTPNFFGTDSFTYRANDGVSDSTAATVSITVNEVPNDKETENIAKCVIDLGETGAINGGQENSLLKKLEAILAKLDKGKTATACNSYRAFIQHVEGLVNGGILSPEQAQCPLDLANNLREELECK